MNFSEKHFQILGTLDSQEISSQRQLAKSTGISLGRINYVLKQLLEKGPVKTGNFRKNSYKIGYTYLLTPKGIEKKSKLAAHFIISKLKEYHSIRNKLAERLISISKNGHKRIVFIGPEIVKEFVDSIIRENALDLTLVGHCSCWESLRNYEPDSFDIAILFDGSRKDTRKIREEVGIPSHKLLPPC